MDVVNSNFLYTTMQFAIYDCKNRRTKEVGIRETRTFATIRDDKYFTYLQNNGQFPGFQFGYNLFRGVKKLIDTKHLNSTWFTRPS